MAQRRMTSLDVIDTDAFLDMGQGAQLLYFHLNARADDDGFVANPKRVLRAIGGNDDDIRLLIAKKFLIAFQDGVCVIKHWRINNFVRKDIYKETKYLDLRGALFIRPNGAYTLTEDERSIPLPKGHFKLEAVNDTLTQRQPRLGKVSEDKTGGASLPPGCVLSTDEPENARSKPVKSTCYQVFEVFKDVLGVYPLNWKTNKTQRVAAENLFKEHGLEQVRKALEFYSETKDEPFCPQVLSPWDLDSKWKKLTTFKNKYGN